MSRLLAALCACVILYMAPAAGIAQSAPTTATVLKLNPLVAEVARVDPDEVWDLVRRLQIAGAGPSRSSGSGRGSDQPIAGEANQIAANPLFAAAFAKQPSETLGILRQVNELLHDR
jgi:hypothetical protein